MADHEDISGPKDESLIDQIREKFHGGDDSSSSFDSDTVEKKPPLTSPSTAKAKIYRLFGREKLVHKVFGGGKPADIFLWRNKKMSGAALGGATVVWVLFELLEYHLLTLVCHISILTLGLLFLWSNVTLLINKKPPQIPEVRLPEDPFLEVASALRVGINNAVAVMREIASGRDLKKFLTVVAVLWVLSILGSCCNFLTLSYILFVLLHTMPVLYEKYDDKIDAYAEKTMAEIKKQYAVFDAKVLCKIPRGPFKDKKKA